MCKITFFIFALVFSVLITTKTVKVLTSIFSKKHIESNVVTLPTQLKTLTFNTGPNRLSIPERYAETLALANFIKSAGIELVGLQERDYTDGADNDKVLLDKAFNEIGYKMYTVQVKEAKNEANIIASKYPFIPNTYKEYMISGGRNRIIQQVAVQTPLGKIWVVNVHTNTARSCDESLQVLDQLTKPGGYFAPPSNENIVIMGDFNVYLNTQGRVTVCESANQINLMNTKLSLYKTSCTTGTCTNRNDPKVLRIIDWTITTLSSPTSINSTWIDNTIAYVGDGHPPIIGLVESGTFTSHSYDINKNGKIDTVDAVDLIKYIFSTSDLNSLYDFNLDGIVNLSDVLILINFEFK